MQSEMKCSICGLSTHLGVVSAHLSILGKDKYSFLRVVTCNNLCPGCASNYLIHSSTDTGL